MTASRWRGVIAWSWPRAVVGAVYALPAGFATLHDPRLGLPLAVGVLPAAIIGLPPRRRARLAIFFLSVLAGLSLLAGSVSTRLPVPVTALVLGAAVVGAALLAAWLPLGRVALVLCAPLVAIGLSFTDDVSGAQALLLLSLGGLYAYLVSLLWPHRLAPARAPAPLPSRSAMLDHGLRLGLAGAIAYVIAAHAGVDHPGWAPAACLLVARPQADLLRIRGVGRLASVLAGALAALLLLRADPDPLVLACVVVAAVAAVSATMGSRWYVTPGFSTLLVFLLMLDGSPEAARATFVERVGETVLGVGAAYVFGWAVPVVRARLGGRADPRP